MELIILLAVLCFITSFVHILIKPVIAFLSLPSKEEKLLQLEIQRLRKELDRIPMKDNFIEYVKLERKIVELDRKLSVTSQNSSVKRIAIKFALPYAAQGVLTVILVIVTIMYRKTPVIIFKTELFNFSPFGGVISYPTNIDGAISTPFWIFVNSFVSRTIAGYVK